MPLQTSGLLSHPLIRRAFGALRGFRGWHSLWLSHGHISVGFHILVSHYLQAAYFRAGVIEACSVVAVFPHLIVAKTACSPAHTELANAVYPCLFGIFFFIFFEAVPYFTLWTGTNKQPHELLQMEVHRAFAVNVLMLYAMVLFRDDEHALKKIFCLNFEEYVWLIVQSYFRVKALILEEWAKRCSAYNGALD